MAMAGAFAASRAFGTEDGSETPLVRFGLVTDLHYADIDTAGSGATARHYRDSLPKLAAAVADFNRRAEDFVVELGDFKDQNDYALISEIVKGVYESDAADAVALFEWVVDETTKVGEWKLGPSAATYGITDATKLTFKINKLIYDKTPKDTEDSFKGRLSIFEAGDTLTPTPTSAVAEGGIDWRNDGTNLEQDKLAGFELEVFYDGESLTKGEGEVTVMKTLSKPHPNHKADGSIWED